MSQDAPPDGYIPDPNDEGWYYNPDGDPDDPATWWHPAPPPPTFLSAIDVSSAQPADLTALIQQYNPDLVVVRLYQKLERIPQQFSLDQIQSVRDNGKLVRSYWWPYASEDVKAGLDDVLTLAATAGLDRGPFADVEKYTDGSEPSAAQVIAVADEYRAQGKVPKFYSSPTMWANAGNPDVGHALAWVATYVDSQPADLSGVTGFGNLSVVGWQWSDVGVDQSIFRHR